MLRSSVRLCFLRTSILFADLVSGGDRLPGGDGPAATAWARRGAARSGVPPVPLAGSAPDERIVVSVLQDRRSGATEEVPAVALFILIGAHPHSDWLPRSIARDEWGDTHNPFKD